MKCNRCKKKISFWEWFRNGYCFKGIFSAKGYCDKCEKIVTKEWINEQYKLIREGKRLPHKIC